MLSNASKNACFGLLVVLSVTAVAILRWLFAPALRKIKPFAEHDKDILFDEKYGLLCPLNYASNANMNV